MCYFPHLFSTHPNEFLKYSFTPNVTEIVLLLSKAQQEGLVYKQCSYFVCFWNSWFLYPFDVFIMMFLNLDLKTNVS